MTQAIGTLDRRVVSSSAQGLRRWIASGVCQHPTGAFAAWLEAATARLSFGYAEITGYALTFLAGQAVLSDDEHAVAHRAADWLAQRVERGSLAARDGWDNGAIYLFDLGMIAAGLLSFGARAQASRFVDAGRRLASFLADELRSSPLSPVAASGPQSRRDAWSTRGHAHLAKLVQALLLAERHGGDGSRGAAERLIDDVKRLQLPDGRMPTGRAADETMLHPHLYAAEGLWIWGSVAGDSDSLERARGAVDWAWAHQLETGGFPRLAGIRAGPDDLEQSDVTAQAARLAFLLDCRSEGRDRAVARLIDVSDPFGDGLAVAYQPTSTHRHLNTCATLFAAQAVALATQPQRSLSWSELV